MWGNKTDTARLTIRQNFCQADEPMWPAETDPTVNRGFYPMRLRNTAEIAARFTLHVPPVAEAVGISLETRKAPSPCGLGLLGPVRASTPEFALDEEDPFKGVIFNNRSSGLQVDMENWKKGNFSKISQLNVRKRLLDNML